MEVIYNKHLRHMRASAWLSTRRAAVSAVALCALAACGSEPAGSATTASLAGTQPSPSGAAGGGAITAPSAAAAKPAATPATPTVAASTPVNNTPAAAAASPAANMPAASAGAGASATAGGLPCGVSKVLASACQNCHGAMPIGGAPMALVTYADLMKPAVTQPNKKVYELVQARVHDTMRPMPPTGALSAPDLAAIDDWAKGGALSIPSAEAAACAAQPTVGNKDFGVGPLTAGPGETCYEFKVHGAQAPMDQTKFNIGDGEFYEQFYYKIPWPKGSAATAYATIPDNAAVLHHWLLFSTNEAQADGNHITAPLPTLIGADPVLLTGWAVGGPNLVAPNDVGFELPDPGTRTLNVQWHFYNSTGKPQQDASKVQICVVPAATKKNIGNVTWLGTEDLNGNKWFGGAGMPPHKESTFTTTCIPSRRGMIGDQPIHIMGFEPHMHRIGKRMQTAVKRKDGTMETIFDKPFNFGNETHYFAEFDLKAGEQLVTSCTFNNDNDFGVPFGESSDTEMCYQFTFAYPAHALANGAPSLLGVPDTCW